MPIHRDMMKLEYERSYYSFIVIAIFSETLDRKWK